VVTECERPIWCCDENCRPLNAFNVEGDHDQTGMCLGRLETATNHGSLKGINDLSWCVLSEGRSRLLVNKDDLISFMILFAAGLKRAGKPLPKWVAEEIQKFCLQ